MSESHPAPGRIICGVDASDTAPRAAGVAAKLAGELGCSVDLIGVMGTGPPLALGFGRPARLGTREARRQLALIAAGAPLSPGTGVRVKAGLPADALARLAREEGAELIVVGTRGLDHVPTTPLDGALPSLVRAAPCPVVIVPRAAVRPPATETLPAIVCGVGGDGRDAPVLQWAAQLARRIGTDLHAVHAYDRLARLVAPPSPPADIDPREAAERTLSDALEASAVGDAHRHLLAVPADLALRRVAGEQRAGLIVVGAREDSSGGLLPHGSVQARLVDEGHTAVVVLPQPAQAEPAAYDIAANAA